MMTTETQMVYEQGAYELRPNRGLRVAFLPVAALLVAAVLILWREDRPVLTVVAAVVLVAWYAVAPLAWSERIVRGR